MGLFVSHRIHGIGKIVTVGSCKVSINFPSNQGQKLLDFLRSAFGDTIHRHVLCRGTPCIIDGMEGVIEGISARGSGGTPHVYEVLLADGSISRCSEERLELRALLEVEEHELDRESVAPGDFVRTDDQHGLGKLVEATGRKATIAFFSSPGKTHVREYTNGWERTYLYPNTRIYWQDDRERWHIGLIKRWFRDEREFLYEVMFPNKQWRFLPEESLFVRCLSADSDPTVIAANGGMETQFYHDARNRFMTRILQQRRMARGLTGALSSSVELVPHQMKTARHILSDPVQRYVLADEVGLGKTIEAGFVIRQVLIDKPGSRIVVLVPSGLVGQWEEELRTKFSVDQFRIQPEVLPFERLSMAADQKLELLVVDEAHHAFTPGMHHDALVELAMGARRLLLITATPVLGNEESFFRMLRVLDPDVHEEGGFAFFCQKVASRQQFGALARSLDKEASPFVLDNAMQATQELLGHDEQVKALLEEAKTAMEQGDATGRAVAVERLQRHVVETYRIFHRLIRNRRKDMPEWVMGSRCSSKDLSHIQVLEARDRTVEVLAGEWEAWRMSALSLLEGRPEEHEDLVRELARDCALLFGALSCGADVFVRTLEGLVLEKRPGGDVPEVRTILQECLELSPDDAEAVAADGLEALRLLHSRVRELRQGTSRPLECVVFVSSERMAEAVRARLASLDKAKVTVLGWRGEEGKNFQGADGIVHLDLPLDPARLEQRIGRLDRFGRKKTFLPQVVRLPLDRASSPWRAWLDVLEHGFRIFSEPISDVQFLLEQEKRALERTLLLEGAAGLLSYGQALPDRLRQERDELDDQYALDAQMEEDGEDEWFEALEEVDTDEEEMARDMHVWMCQALAISRLDEDGDGFTYSWHPERTAIPREPWAAMFVGGMERPATFDRIKAAKNGDVDLVRLGHPLIDGVERFTRWDTRGVAFASWRACPVLEPDTEPWVGLKLFYVVEGDLRCLERDVRQRLNLAVARRRADSFFLPWTRTIYLDLNLEPVQNETLLHALAQSKTGSEGRSLNLGSRRELLAQAVDLDRLGGIVSRAADKGRDIIRSEEEFQHSWRQGRHRVGVTEDQRRRRLARRKEALESARAPSATIQQLEDEAALDSLVAKAVENPTIRLDSLGVIVLSHSLPESA